MSPTRGRTLLLLMLPMALVAWGIGTYAFAIAGWYPLPALWIPLPPVLAALVLLALGWQVRQLRDHKPSSIRPASAPVVAAAAKAGSVVGALVSGYYLGFLPLLATEAGLPGLLSLVLRSLLCAAGYVALMAVGMVVERWCRIELDDEPGSPSASGYGSPATA